MAGCDRCESNVPILPGFLPAGPETRRAARSRSLRSSGYLASIIARLCLIGKPVRDQIEPGRATERILLLGHLRDSSDLERTVPVRVMISSVNEYGVRGSRRDCFTSVHKVKGLALTLSNVFASVPK